MILRTPKARILLYTALLSALVGAIFYFGGIKLLRPPKSIKVKQLFEGIKYLRYYINRPRPMMEHVISVDLQSPGVDLRLTPPPSNDLAPLFPARTITSFLKQTGTRVAINGDYFGVSASENTTGSNLELLLESTLVRPRGFTKIGGKIYVEASGSWASLCLQKKGLVDIQKQGCEQSFWEGISGGIILVDDGRRMLSDTRNDQLEPRSGVAINTDGNFLWLIVVDGRQTGYSEGASLPELARMMVELGAYKGMELDGGGSSTLAIEGTFGPRLLNVPIHNGVPFRERPVANHIGVYAKK